MTLRSTIASLVLVLSAIGIATGQAIPNYEILKSGERFQVSENIEAFIAQGKLDKSEEINGTYYRLLQFYFLPDRALKTKLENAGIRLLGYIPNNAYIASIPVDTDPEFLKVLQVRSILPLNAAWKESRRVRFEDYGDWAVHKSEIELLITYFSDLDQSSVRAYCRADDIEVVQGNGHTNVLHVRIPLDRISELSSLPYVSWVDIIPEPGEPEDTRGRALHRANAIDTRFEGGRKYTGEGINIQTRDDGEVGPHIDFQGRVTNIVNGPQGGTHGDGVSGIFTGAGNLDPYMRGMAAGAHLFVTNYQSNFLDTTLNLHLEQDVLVTNSSYGNGCNAGYTTTSQTVDQQVYENPTYLHVFSAGNSGTSDCGYGAGSNWGNITGGHKQGTNVIATANLEQDYSLRNSSSRGPAYDGRIKPDIAANGHAHQSTNPYNSYISFSGTSGAAPGIAGITAQLHQAYQEHTGGETAESALLKSILLNTANDLGNPGPDYKYGWGHVNALRAARVIEEDRFFSGVVDQLEQNNHSFIIPPNTRQAKIMVYWHDFPAEPEAEQALVNDLDAVLTDVIGNSWQPMVLDTFPNAAQLDLPAQPGEDHLNNMEQIILTDPDDGLYYLNIEGFNVPMGPVKYWVVTEFITDEVELIYPYGGEGLAPGEVIRIHWDGFPNGELFDLEYSTDNGQSWSVIFSGLQEDTHHWDWQVPDVLTGEALIRVSRGGESDVCETPFSIIPTPENLEITKACPEFIRMEWDEVPGATHYTVYQLGNRYMDSVTTVDFTLWDFPTTDLNPGLEYWFSVRAEVPDQDIVGERAIAIPYNSGLLNCVQEVDISLLSLDNPNQEAYTICSFNDFPVTISGINQGMTVQSNVEVGYAFNGDVFTEMLPNTLAVGESFTHTFSQQPNIDASGTFALTTWVHLDDDSAMFNDSTGTTLNINYYPGTGEELQIQEDWEVPGLQPYWQIVSDDAGITWEPIDSIIGITGEYTRAYWMDNYSYPSGSAIDRIITVPIDLTDPTLESPSLLFDVSYAPYPSADYIDTFQVEIYTDCQLNLAAIPYQKWEDDLATTTGTFAEFEPTSSSHWRTEGVDLSPYIGEVIVIHFVNNTGYGNSLYLDNINILELVPPIAYFEPAPDTLCQGDSWTFEDASTGDVSSYEWYFSNNANPVAASGPGPHEVVFEQTGETTITHIVSNSVGGDTLEQVIYVNAPASAEFSYTISDLQLSFSNLSVNADNYSWDFGDGLGQSTEAEPVYEYTAPGEYIVTLQATNECGTSEFELTISLSADGINSKQAVWDLSLAPNPNDGQFILSLDNPEKRQSVVISILDISGKLVYENDVSINSGNQQFQMDVRNFSSGLYILRVSDGTRQSHRKFVIE
ncbi:MAG: S8 family serine peptidase [Bacteroidetes bacterium]|nr:S8 family serine peptidase [Bacteroidota bacterium]